MKRLFFLLMGVGVTVAVAAQNPVVQEKKKAEMNELKKDVKEKKEERKEMGKAAVHGKFKKAIHERKDVRSEKREIKKDEERLEKQGVKHPVKKARHKLNREEQAKKEKI